MSTVRPLAGRFPPSAPLGGTASTSLRPMRFAMLSADGRNRIELRDDANTSLGRYDVRALTATVSRVQCVLLPAGQATLTLESCGTNPTGVRESRSMAWQWLKKGDRVDGLSHGWQLALDRALPAEALFTLVDRFAASLSMASGPGRRQAKWSWACGSGWRPFSSELTQLLEDAFNAGASSLVLDSERRAVFVSMRQVGCLSRCLQPASGFPLGVISLAQP